MEIETFETSDYEVKVVICGIFPDDDDDCED